MESYISVIRWLKHCEIFEAGKCGNGDNCFVEISDLAQYKNISSRNSLNPHFRDYNIDVWKEIVNVFSMRISCLLGNAEVISYEQYLDEANPYDIFMCEQALAGNNKVFIISASRISCGLFWNETLENMCEACKESIGYL